jgi:MFS family permease
MEQAVPLSADKANRRVMTTLALSMMLGSLGTSITNVALPALTEAFAAPFHDVQWVVVAYLAALTVSVVIAGRLGDTQGLRRMLLAGLGLFSVASLLSGFAPDLPILIGARVLQGIGAAFLVTLTIALLRETASPERMGRAMGLLGTVSALGTALGPSLGGALLSAAGWRSIFLVQVALAMLALILTFACLPRDTPRKWTPPAVSWVRQDIALVPNLLVNLLVAAVMMTTLVVGPFYLGLRLGLTEALIGLVMSVGPLISILSGIPSGWAVDALGARRVLRLGLILLGTGALLLSVLPETLGVAGYVTAIFVLTPGYQLSQCANNTAVMADVPKDQRGAVSGLLSLSRNIGLVVGASAMGAVFAIGVGTSDLRQASPLAIASGMRLTFVLAGFLMVVALWMSLGRTSRNERS